MITSSNDLDERYSEIQDLRISNATRDKGISIGANLISASAQEWGEGYGMRAGGKIKMLGSGWKQSSLEVRKLENIRAIANLEGNQESMQYHYGLCYDYIISLYHHQKLILLNGMLDSLTHLSAILQDHYIHKRIPYADLLQCNNAIREYSTLKHTTSAFIEIFRQSFETEGLPQLHDFQFYDFDVQGLLDSLASDSTQQKVLSLELDNVDLEYAQMNLSDLSASVGYDLLRSRPYFSIQFSKNIHRSSKKLIQAEKELLKERDHHSASQRKKEIINLFLEYDYKKKQVDLLRGKQEMINETKRILQVTRSLQGLPESVEEQELTIDSLKIEYEILDLKQQSMLLLLRMKRLAIKVNIGKFLKPIRTHIDNKKFAGNRFLLLLENHAIAKADEYFLEECEVEILSGQELIEMRNLYPLNPSDYNHRSEMEEKIISITEKDSRANILFTDIESLKELELKSVRTQVHTN